MKKRLRSGYTTGACAAAAARAAAILATTQQAAKKIRLIFPDGSRHEFEVEWSKSDGDKATAAIIKDAGDDPDVTNGALIVASVEPMKSLPVETPKIFMENITIIAGEGVGTATKPGLAVAPGEPAINPVPRQMIHQAVADMAETSPLLVTISIPRGKELATRTLNERLGIVGGLSILGTTGLVRPVSAEAWTATIEASLNVAKEAGLEDVVLSTGRTSEKGAQSLLDLPIEAYAMMGDYLEFSLEKAAEKGFSTIHLAGMWAKIVKAALQIPQTHVRHGALDVEQAAILLSNCGADQALVSELQEANTARQMYTILAEQNRDDIVTQVCLKAQDYAEVISQRRVKIYLVNAKAEVITNV